MDEPTATLNPDDQPAEQQRAFIGDQPKPPRGGAMKFAYASGSRPLDGYTIKRGIGTGGFGEVYFATSDAGKEVALKRIQRNLDVELRGVKQCLNLKHINLISLWDIRYDERGEAWVVMEYVSGESLKDVIDRNPNGLPREEVHRWFHEILAGVSYLHDHGLVHRDLKPGNIFLDQDIVKIGDYGLSKFISCSRRSGQTESVGTFHYMAPEIGKGVYGKEIDIYALGVILFEMLTGRVPFDGESSQEIMMKHLTADPDLDDVAKPYRKVIRIALAKDPDLRYRTVQALAADWPDAVAESVASASSAHDQPVPDTLEVPPGQPTSSSTPVYIRGDEDGIVLGDVKEVVTAKSAAPQGPAAAAASIQMAREEPIAKAFKGGFGRAVNWWYHSGMSTPLKVGVLLGVSLLLVLNRAWLVPLSIFLACVYFVYYAVRSIVLAVNYAPKSREPRPAAKAKLAPAPEHRRRLRRESRKDILRQALASRSSTEVLTELTGSMLFSAIVCGVLCLVMMAIGGQEFDGSVQSWSFYTWLTVSGTMGAWIILGVSKFWEGSEGDDVRRRFLLLGLGLLLGATAYGSTELFMLSGSPEFAAAKIRGPFEDLRLPASMETTAGTLRLPAFLIFFGGLFLVLRWWRQADPLRSSRLSLWSTGLCVLWGLILPFPQPWGVILAGVVAVAVQLSAPWMKPQERAYICEHFYRTHK